MEQVPHVSWFKQNKLYSLTRVCGCVFACARAYVCACVSMYFHRWSDVHTAHIPHQIPFRYKDFFTAMCKDTCAFVLELTHVHSRMFACVCISVCLPVCLCLCAVCGTSIRFCVRDSKTKSFNSERDTDRQWGRDRRSTSTWRWPHDLLAAWCGCCCCWCATVAASDADGAGADYNRCDWWEGEGWRWRWEHMSSSEFLPSLTSLSCCLSRS